VNAASQSRPPVVRACAGCLARTWLIGRLAGHLDVGRGRALSLLELDDDELIAAVAGGDRLAIAAERERFEPEAERRVAVAAGTALICRCDPDYPRRLRDLPAPPAVLYVAGQLERFLVLCERDPVAIVGTRRPTSYGIDVARGLARQLAVSGLTVISGMARGVDAAAHGGALAAGGGGTVAVLAGPPDRAYPASKRLLHAALVREAAVIGELGPGTAVRRWMFPARNRIIAALSDLTIVVEAGERSGALLTARLARELGRVVGGVPGRISTPQAAGPNGLIAAGAATIRGAQDAVDELFGAGVRELAGDDRPPPTEAQAALLSALEGGASTAVALARAGLGADRGLAELASLELAGRVRREPGGRYSVIP
jgi:DNA processing protein